MRRAVIFDSVAVERYARHIVACLLDRKRCRFGCYEVVVVCIRNGELDGYLIYACGNYA